MKPEKAKDEAQSSGKKLPAARTPRPPAMFSVSARVAMQLGRESISSSNTAIVELVKNAYDADAEQVTVRFAKLGTPSATLIIEDNGHGMTESEIRTHWLCIGTTHKSQSGRSMRKRRVQTGEKGLGRLGLDRLCRRTLLQTLRKPDNDPADSLLPRQLEAAVELDLNWESYEAADQRLETIQHDLAFVEHLNFDPITLEHVEFLHGTRMILEGLKDEWDRERINELRDELSLLLSPFGRPDDFSIVVDSGNDWSDTNGLVLPPDDLLSLANWKIEAEIRPTVRRTGQATQRAEEVTIRITSPLHERVFIPEPMFWSDFTRHKNFLGKEASKCGPLKFEFYVFVRDAEELAKRGSGITEITDFLLSNRGIRIYRDGFRVKPYGDPSGQNDWLTLSLRRATNPAAISRPNWKVAYHQVVGAVFIHREENIDLIDQTNREGLVDGPAFDDLRLFAEKVVHYFEGRAHDDSVAQEPRPATPLPKSHPQAAKAALEKADAAVKALSGDPSSDPSPSHPTDLIEEAIAEAKAEVDRMHAASEALLREKETQVNNLESEMSIMTSLASLGIMTASFGHERVNDATEVLNDAARLRAYVVDPQATLFSKDDQLEMLDHLVMGAQRIDAFAKFALDHVRPRKREKDSVKLTALLIETLKVFDELLVGRFRVSVTTAIPETDPCEVPGWIAGWESVLVNFITNASWALGQRPASERKIRVTVSREGGEILLRFEDSGIGLEAGTEEDIFRPGFSTKRDQHGRMNGTGMGLSIVRSFVTHHRGTVSSIAHSSLGGAGFEVRVPSLATQLS